MLPVPAVNVELRANAARQAANGSSSSNGSPLSNNELLRRLRETQALLVKFSEENGRLAKDNEKLQVRCHCSCHSSSGRAPLYCGEDADVSACADLQPS